MTAVNRVQKIKLCDIPVNRDSILCLDMDIRREAAYGEKYIGVVLVKLLGMYRALFVVPG